MSAGSRYTIEGVLTLSKFGKPGKTGFISTVACAFIFANMAVRKR